MTTPKICEYVISKVLENSSVTPIRNFEATDFEYHPSVTVAILNGKVVKIIPTFLLIEEYVEKVKNDA